MKALILAAGFATRLHPLTLTQPKHLLPIAGKPMIEHILAHLAAAAGVDRVDIVTNSRFAGHFERWKSDAQDRFPNLRLGILDDGVHEESLRLGAIGDLLFAIDQTRIDEDIVVVAGDNLFSQPLAGFSEACRSRSAPVLGIYDVGSLDLAKRYNNLELDDDGRILKFEEKSAQPASTLVGIALYYYPRHVLPLMRQYASEGQNLDKPGRLVEWLCPRIPFYTWQVPGLWYDIGTKEALEEANRILSKRAG